ncbi:Legumain [Meloidogyne graminicola]|uniref:Legumain n=1 Tax=Meloidogyne graminicola TaxID=189291 RepID=A0A8S9ZU97_9BILA|nr:Legumain [Meloidogyne graminicola]
MSKRNMYKELTFYLETCEAGSMFNFSMPENIYAMTATNMGNNSYGCHCRTKFLPKNCLNDCFSYNWMHDSDKGNLLKETLNEQFVYVQRKTKLSPVSIYGNTSIMQETISEFMGAKANILTSKELPQLDASNFPSYPSIDIPLNILEQELAEKKDVNTSNELQTLKKNRSFLDDQINQIVKLLVNDSSTQSKVLTIHPAYITDMDCHNNVMHAFNDYCFNFAESNYAFKYGFVLTNLCESGIDSNKIVTVLETHCKQAKTLNVKGII